MNNEYEKKPMNDNNVVKTTEDVKRILKFTADQKALLKRAMMPEATADELEAFVYFCEKHQLDPFLKQVAPNKRWNKDQGREVVTPIIAIDGMRLLADRSGKYLGQTAPQWCDEKGKWSDVWMDNSKHPFAARVGVYRREFREPIYAVAKWNSYAAYFQKNNQRFLSPMWEKMAEVMLAKCAEALALRKAFPAETSGMFIHEEMMQAENEPTSKNYPLEPKTPTTTPPEAETSENQATVAENDTPEAPLDALNNFLEFLTQNGIEESFVVSLCKKAGLVPNEEFICEVKHFQDDAILKINHENYRQRILKRWNESKAPQAEPVKKEEPPKTSTHRADEDDSQEHFQRDGVEGNKYLMDAEFCENGWKKVCVHFGKNQGVNVIQLKSENPKSFNWYMSKWTPQPYKGRMSDKDLQLDAALVLIAKNEIQGE